MTLDNKMLADLVNEMKDVPEMYRPSIFWEQLAAAGIWQLQESGFENFKRTVNMKYFNWNVLGIIRHQLPPVLGQWLRHPDREVFTAEFPDYRSRQAGVKTFNAVSAAIYKTYVAILWEYVATRDPLGLLKSLPEPVCGNPFRIRYKSQWVSQDVCNSVHEFYSAGGREGINAREWNVAELGAGYGRLAYVFLNALPASTYCIIDIPPALNIAQQYLTEVFPKEKMFGFRRFARYEDIKDEFESSRIRFLAAPQIELLPPKHFDLFVNISSLHEMTYPQIKNYLAQIDRVCRGRFYTKQWRVSRATVNGFVIRESEYPIPPSWRTVFHRQHPIQRMFFEALYQVGNPA